AAIYRWRLFLRASGGDDRLSLWLAAVSQQWLHDRLLAPAGRCSAATTGSLVLRSRIADVDCGCFSGYQEPLRLPVLREGPSRRVLHRNGPTLATGAEAMDADVRGGSTASAGRRFRVAEAHLRAVRRANHRP